MLAPSLHMAAPPEQSAARRPLLTPLQRPDTSSRASPKARPDHYYFPRDCSFASTGASNKRSTIRGRCCSRPAVAGLLSWSTSSWRPSSDPYYGQRCAAPSSIPSNTLSQLHAAAGWPGSSAKARPLSWPPSCYPSALSTTVWRPWGSWWPGDCHYWPGRPFSMYSTGQGVTWECDTWWAQCAA